MRKLERALEGFLAGRGERNAARCPVTQKKNRSVPAARAERHPI